MRVVMTLALKTLALSLALGAAQGATPAEARDQRGQGAHRGRSIVEFDTMIGVPRPFTGGANAIRGVPGGGLPWVIGAARGELRADGQLKLRVEGLVFDPNDDAVIERGLANTNTVPFFMAIVSCLSRDLDGGPVTVNQQTALFEATTGPASEGGGNATIEAHLDLPEPCIAPIVFVTSPGGAWFASSGH